MTDHEFDEITALWNEPDVAEQAAFEAMARKARRKGRLLGYADIALAILVVAPLPAIFLTLSPALIASALFVLVATVWLSLVRRRLLQMAATLTTSSPAAFLESSVRIAAANVRRVNLSLMLAAPVFAVAIMAKGLQRSDGRFDHLARGVWAWASSPRGLAALAIVVLIIAMMVRSRGRLKAEVGRLEDLRQDFEEEKQRDEGA